MRAHKRTFQSLIVLSMLFTSAISYGLDTDLYVLSGVDIPPNVLIILDSSASMDEVASGQNYDPGIDYSLYSPATVYSRYAVYIKGSGNKWTLWLEDYTEDDFSCSDLKDNYLAPFGEAINYSNSGCGINKKDFQTGNFMNYLQLSGGPGGSRSRFGLANGIIHSYVNTTGGVRFSVMVFNRDSAGNVVKFDKQNPNKGEFVFGNAQDDPLNAEGGRVLGFVDENKNGKTGLFNALSGFKNDSWSPLAETLYDAGRYFQFGKDGFPSPISSTLYCQKNYVLIISDGNPTKDGNPTLTSLGDLTGDGKAGMLDDVARHLFDTDLSNNLSTTKQNIKTYTIGFSITHPLLESTAKQGGGKYFYVWSSQSFDVAFQNFIAEVLKENVSYVAPVVPISQMESSTAGNRLYLAMFKPTTSSFWKGNIKKFGLATKKNGILVDGNDAPVSNPDIKVGDVLDANGDLAIVNGAIRSETGNMAKSYWSAAPDGEDVEQGGVGEILLNRTSPRKIYTNMGSSPDLTNASNAFLLSNNLITPAVLGLSAGDTTGRNNIINFIHGIDAYDDNRNGNVTEKREWVLGAFIHSRPVVIHYADRSVIFAGGNGGMLHAFDDSSGEELWGFIPSSLLPSLKNLRGEMIQFFVDGAPRAYLERNSSGTLTKALLLFGLRRGGNRYIALDVTNYNSPTLLYQISPSSSGYGELGQTWSTPNIAKVKLGTEEKRVAFIGGGYDENQDNLPVAANDTKGRAVYVMDVLTGNLIWSYSHAKNTAMKYSIPSDISRVDTDGDGKIDRLYVGDMGGRVWRFDIGDPDTAKWTGKIVFNSNPGASDQRKIFYPPDVTLEKENYEMLFFGTGDREHPKSTTTVNRIYAVKDKNLSTTLTETDLVDVTLDLLQSPTTTETEKNTILAELSQKNGWYIKLNENLGEKSLSNSVLFHGVAYFTTFTPEFGQPGDICFLGEGKGRLYAIEYRTGNAVFNFDGSLDGAITRSDRSTVIGPSIPSGVIITFIGGEAVAYVGVGGGVYSPPVPKKSSLIPINWRIRF